MLLGREKLASLTNKLFWLLAIGGIVALALALFLFVSEHGLQYGTGYWGVSGIVCSFIVIFFLTGNADGIRSILAVLAFAVGIYCVALRADLSTRGKGAMIVNPSSPSPGHDR